MSIVPLSLGFAANVTETAMDEVLPIEAIDWAGLLKQMRGNPRLVQVLVEATLAETPNMLAAVRSAMDRGDAPGLQLAAHTLKGTLRYFGETAAYQWAVSLEKMAGSRDLSEAGDSVAKLESGLEPLGRSLQAYLNGNRAQGGSGT
jgi:HPt (histidine-containing phosphotransfer) domain-containing protein